MKEIKIVKAQNGFVLHVKYDKFSHYYICYTWAALFKRLKTELKNWGGDSE